MKSSRLNILLLLLLLVTAIVRLVSLSGTVSSKQELPLVLVLLLVTLLTLAFSPENLPWMKKRYVTIGNIFLLSFLIVHFQDFVDLVMIPGNFEKTVVYSDSFVTVRTAYISLLGVISYSIGHCISQGRSAVWKRKNTYWQFNPRSLQRISTILYAISLVLFVFVNGRTYLSGNYNQETLNNMSGTLGTYIVVLMGAFFVITVISVSIRLSATGSKITLGGYLSGFSPFFYICMLTYLFFVVSFGDRGPVITYVMTFAGGFFVTSKKNMNVVTLIVLLLITATVISVWGMMRLDKENGLSFKQRATELYSDHQTISPATSELAGSNKVTIMAIESTPSQFPYRYGLFTFNNLVSIIPFSSSILRALGIHIPPTLAHSSSFLNWYDHGDNANAAGVGTSTIADIYFDFGWPGVIIVMLLLGMLFRKTDATVFSRPINEVSPFVMVMFMDLFSQAIYIPRSVTLFQLRNIIWYYLILMLLTFVHRKA